MIDWKYHLDLRQEWKRAKAGELTAAELGRHVAAKAAALLPYAQDDELRDIVAEFEILPEDATLDDFDDVLEELYDWGDQGKMCWIATS